ncbi:MULTISPECIES: carbohydrate ABC transporter permease [unclassified Paenibacillus]|uniref:carbohydrate ABC transporter permease n=1 Tax=unclassified Paenibacillus TaxID=185978 RepID=UPI0008AB7AB7|nr:MULTISPECIES: carbohydrate ABC transporter permease [unclassified Paenibacillus]SEN73478.1 putative aldouronate transport system permease protein [Paenibacillus sp. OK076]
MKGRNSIWQWSVNIILMIIALSCILPFILLFISSITDEQSIVLHGYSFFPEAYSLSAYRYLWNDIETILRSYGITIMVTVIGTVISMIITSMLAYPLTRKDMPLNKFWSFFIFFTMLFNGGLVPTYLVYTQLFDLKNTLFALIIPGLLTNAFYVMLMRTFFSNSIPAPVMESAKIDGAGEFVTFVRIVLPLSLPILATVGLFQTIHYWNDWFNGMIYITDSKLYSLQNMLNRILLDIQFLSNSNFSGTQFDSSANIPTETVRMAMAVIGIIPLLIVYPFFQKFFVKGLTIGSVKG